jgi:hypothetical protein
MKDYLLTFLRIFGTALGIIGIIATIVWASPSNPLLVGLIVVAVLSAIAAVSVHI